MTGPRGLEMAAACLGVDSQDLGTILDPFRTIFDDLGPNRLDYLRLEHCDIGTVETSGTSTVCTGIETRQMFVFATEDICPFSAADIRFCPVSTADIRPVSTEDIYPVSIEDITAAGWRPAAVPSSVETG